MAPLVVYLAMGIALSACAGLRAFLPLFCVGLAARFELIELSPAFAWVAGSAALIVFGSAVLLELAADKLPFVDHLLDVVAGVLKPVAGALVMAALVSEWTPLSLTVVSIVAGGSIAGLVHAGKSQARVASSLTTFGLANPLLSLVEDGLAIVGAVAAIVVPLVAAAVVLCVVVLVGLLAGRLLYRRRPGTPGAAQSVP